MAGVRKSRASRGRYSSSPKTISETEEETCPICFETLATKVKGGRAVRSSWAPSSTLGGKVLCDCGHAFCRECLATYVSMAIRERRTSHGMLRCPIDNCKAVIEESLLRNLADPQDWEKHRRFVDEQKLVQHRLLRLCPRPQCDGWARLACHVSNTKTYVDIACRTCHHHFCANFGSGPHQGEGCEQACDQGYFNWKSKHSIKSCPGCGHHVQKAYGCSHMACMACGTDWCWKCGCKYRWCKCWKTYRRFDIITLVEYYEHLVDLIGRLRGVPGWVRFLLIHSLIFVPLMLVVEAYILLLNATFGEGPFEPVMGLFVLSPGPFLMFLGAFILLRVVFRLFPPP